MATENITALLNHPDGNNPKHLNAVFEACYDELKRIARIQLNKLPNNGTITPTVLMHECYLKFLKAQDVRFQDSKHFMCALAKSMRFYLIDTYRSNVNKPNNIDQKLTKEIGDKDIHFGLMEMEEIFSRIEAFNPHFVHLIELKLFIGLEVKQIAELLDYSERQIIRQWKTIKSMIKTMLAEPKK